MHWLASAAALLGLCYPTIARAQTQPGSDGIPIVVEAHLGWNDPLGTYGLALVYDRGGIFSGGLGVGLNSLKSDTLPPLGLFGRARLLRWGWGSLGVGAALSRDHYSSDQGDDGVWYWNPSYRATGTAAAELTNRRSVIDLSRRARRRGGLGRRCSKRSRLFLASRATSTTPRNSVRAPTCASP